MSTTLLRTNPLFPSIACILALTAGLFVAAPAALAQQSLDDIEAELERFEQSNTSRFDTTGGSVGGSEPSFLTTIGEDVDAPAQDDLDDFITGLDDYPETPNPESQAPSPLRELSDFGAFDRSRSSARRTSSAVPARSAQQQAAPARPTFQPVPTQTQMRAPTPAPRTLPPAQAPAAQRAVPELTEMELVNTRWQRGAQLLPAIPRANLSDYAFPGERSGNLHFHNAPISDMVEEMGMLTPKRILLLTDYNRTITHSFPVTRWREYLEVIARENDLKVEETEREIIITDVSGYMGIANVHDGSSSLEIVGTEHGHGHYTHTHPHSHAHSHEGHEAHAAQQAAYDAHAAGVAEAARLRMEARLAKMNQLEGRRSHLLRRREQIEDYRFRLANSEHAESYYEYDHPFHWHYDERFEESARWWHDFKLPGANTNMQKPSIETGPPSKERRQ